MFTFCSLSAHCAKRRNNLLTFHCGKRTCLLSVHFVKRRNNLLTFHCRKRTCLLSVHFAKRRNNLLTLHCRKRRSSLCTVKKPIYRKRTSSLCTVKKPIYRKKNVFTFCGKKTVSLLQKRNNLLNYHCRKRLSSLSAVKKQFLHFLQ